MNTAIAIVSIILTVFSVGVVFVVGIGSVFLLFTAHRRERPGVQ